MNRALRGLLVLLVGAVLPALVTTEAYGANFDTDVRSTYTVQTDRTVQVTTTLSVTNNVDTQTPSVMVVPVAGQNLTSISARYGDGGSIAANLTDDGSELRLDTTLDRSGLGNQWSVVVSYVTQLGEAYGPTYFVIIPSLDYNDIEVATDRVELAVPLEIGIGVPRGGEPLETTVSSGNQVVVWENQEGRINRPVGLAFGDRAVGTVNVEHTLTNQSWWWQTRTVTLPPDTNQQSVFLNSVSPAPNQVRLDVDGNILLEYSLRPRQSIEVSASATLTVNNFIYALDSPAGVNDIPQQLRERYLESWNAGEVVAPAERPAAAAELMRAVLDAVVEKSQVDAINGDGYDAALERANRLVASLRAEQIPARLVLGKVFGNGNELFARATDSAWVEAYAPNTGWVTLDPTYQVVGDFFGVSDVQHVAMVLRGIDPEFPPEQLADTSVEYTNDEPPAAVTDEPVVSGTKYMILPGIAMQSLSVALPNGTIVDGTGLQVGDDAVQPLGSLAPLQTARLRSFAIGAGAFTSASVQYGSVSSATLGEVFAQGTTTTSYLPMIVLVGAVALLWSVQFGIRKLWERRTAKPKKSKTNMTFASEDDGDDVENADLLDLPRMSAPEPAPEPDPETAPAQDDTIPPDETDTPASLPADQPTPRQRRRGRRRNIIQ